MMRDSMIMIGVSILFIFIASVAHKVIHSFPTRRSSDLGEACAFVAVVIKSEVRQSRRSRQNRSEEHTSELQSLRHLVCRLLLEKKNILKFMRVSIKMIGIFDIQIFIASMTQTLTLSDFS